VTAAQRWALGAWLALLAASAVIVARTTISTDVSAFLPRSPTPEQQVLVEQLREGVVSRLALIALEGASPAALAQASKAMAAELRKDASFVSVVDGAVNNKTADRAFLWRQRYLLSSAVDAERFSAAGLRERLEETLRLRDSPAAQRLDSLAHQPFNRARRLRALLHRRFHAAMIGLSAAVGNFPIATCRESSKEARESRFRRGSEGMPR